MATNKETDEKAMKLVFDYERSNGRVPKRIDDKDLGYDILSSGRKIEVKGADHGEVFKGFVIEDSQHQNFKDQDFWLYRVLKVSSNEPIILPIKPDEINLSIAQKPRYNATSFKNKDKPRKF
ncbi:MAG: DUF3883 domain-containing protein [Dehalococcoidales bacterium]|nr:DUF3883 domain-containing protein [Dehalococcoidales bacterium]